jgi:hypothetical protein
MEITEGSFGGEASGVSAGDADCDLLIAIKTEAASVVLFRFFWCFESFSSRSMFALFGVATGLAAGAKD